MAFIIVHALFSLPVLLQQDSYPIALIFHLHHFCSNCNVDVRGLAEYEDVHIEGIGHVFVGTLQGNLDKIGKDKQVVIHCQSGDRSAIAYYAKKKWF